MKTKTQKEKPAATPVVDPEVALIVRDAPVLAGLANAHVAFFKHAAGLDAAAALTLANVQSLPAPKSASDDVVVQQLAKQTSEAKKAVEQHWAITQLAYSIHKTLTAMRKRTTDKLDQANAIANRLHNAWVTSERDRVAREQEELRLAAEAKARAEREEERARLEAEALEREASSPDMSAREREFVRLYTLNPGVSMPNPITCAEQAGYKDPQQSAERLRRMQKIQAAITAALEAAAIRRQAAAKAAEPLVVDVPEVAMNVTRAAGTTADRTTWSAELLDEKMLIAAILQGGYGIPEDLLRIDAVRLNQYARDLHEQINKWPGCRAKSTTKVV